MKVPETHLQTNDQSVTWDINAVTFFCRSRRINTWKWWLGRLGRDAGAVEEVRVSQKLRYGFVASPSHRVGEVLSSALGKLPNGRNLVRWKSVGRNKLLQVSQQPHVSGLHSHHLNIGSSLLLRVWRPAVPSR